MAGPLYDFVVYTKKGREEKLHYMHQNPVRRGLVLTPEQWPWGSAREYLRDEAGPVLVNEPLRAEMKVRDGTRKDPPAAESPKTEKVKSPLWQQPEIPAFEKREDRGSLRVVVSSEREGQPPEGPVVAFQGTALRVLPQLNTWAAAEYPALRGNGISVTYLGVGW